MEQVDRVEEPTTLVFENEVPRSPRRVHQWHEHLSLTLAYAADVVLHNREPAGLDLAPNKVGGIKDMEDVKLDGLTAMAKLLPAAMIALLLSACVSAGSYVTYRTANPELAGRLCKPQGTGPFPAVIFHHGGLGSSIGGAPDTTCAALSDAGYVGFSPIRRQTRSLFGHLDDVFAALEYVKSVPGVDGARIGMIGFSRGAMLAYQFAAGRHDIKALVLMAAAAGRRGDGLTSVDAGAAVAPILMLVAANDTGSRTTMGGNVKSHMIELAAVLKAAGRDHRMIIYPPFGGDGHQLFFQVGAYWPDVTAFLDRHLKR